ncbi:unnamed protein product [Alopecurus aequalis]
MEPLADEPRSREYNFIAKGMDFSVTVTLRASIVESWVRNVKKQYLDATPIKCVGLDCKFTDRVHGGVVPSRLLLAYGDNNDNNNDNGWPLVNLLHPATPAASRFTEDILVPYISPRAADLLRHYDPITSRGGLVLLRRRFSEPDFDLCVYNPMTGDCTYLSSPPGLSKRWYYLKYVLLTAADGIDSSFLLVVAEVGLYNRKSTRSIRVQTAASSTDDGAIWGPVRCFPFWPLKRGNSDAVVLHGGVINWLLSNNERILTYDVRTEKLGTAKLPPSNHEGSQQILGTSPDGMLRFLVANGLIISSWLQLSEGWVPEVVIDTEEKLRLLCPYIPPGPVLAAVLDRLWERSNVVLLRFHNGSQGALIIIFDLETEEMRIHNSYPFSLFEVDLPTRLQAIRIFS